MVARYGTIDTEYATRLATTPADADGPVWMINLMKYREVADYLDGDGDGPALSGREADDLYVPHDALAAVGAEIVFAGDVDQQLLGDAPVWDRVGVVRYPTRRAFVEMQTRDDFRRRHVHKDAGMEQTIVIGSQPLAVPPFPPGVDDVAWEDVAHPPTGADGPVVVVHVIRYAEAEARDRTPEEMEAYQNAASVAAARHGVRVSGWFAAEGTIVGDGRQWDQVRFNGFPSKRAFMAVVTDPDRLAAQRDHREVAIADTYTMIVRATIDRLAEATPT